MNVLLHPTYFPNVAHFVSIIQADKLLFEIHDNYQKQTYRNRAYVNGANGKLALNVPINHTHKNRQLYKDVRIANDAPWQKQHWKSLQSAYKTSPFFEFYEDALAPLFFKKHKFILDLNFECFEVIFECLQFDFNYKTTLAYEDEPNNCLDYRFLVNARKGKEYQFKPYTQVFSTKHGYLNNLSILDLLFNEGTNSINYLQSQNMNQ